MSENSNAGKSFADRYGKKEPSFSSNKLDDLKKKEENSGFTTGMTPPSEKKLSSVSPEKRALAQYIYLVKGTDRDRKAWYYVLVERLKVQLFLKALNDDIIHLENYGKILYSAYGEEPPESVTTQLKEEYGIKD